MPPQVSTKQANNNNNNNNNEESCTVCILTS